ncbi:MAG: Skp family chaperone for outer membrane protein [Flavobacteriaceae bacterium]|jgi:Skp family chaperone for outer membrane proteins|uniref:hypothetical protein n=1 Tax=Candidatus Marifrigoribacter sp. Uisw_064 TaxID=3230970 RepID=UPI003AEDC346
MKKIILIAVFIISTGVLAQRPNHEKMKAFKIAHITQQLDLTSSEAEKFWPIYNAFDSKMETLRKEGRSNIFEKTKGDNINNISDSEATEIMNEIIAMKTKELQNRKELVNDLKGILSPIKILKHEIAEENFKRKLLDRLKKRRGGKEKH